MNLAELQDNIKKEFPSFAVKKKTDSWMMKVLDILVKIITFGSVRYFMTHFITTIGYTIYVTDSWEEDSEIDRMAILRHERIHMRQLKKYTWPLFWFLYLFCPLPLGFAYFRMKFEMEGYAETMKAHYELIGEKVFDRLYRAQMIDRFTGSAYGWAWLGQERVERWYDETLQKVLTV